MAMLVKAIPTFLMHVFAPLLGVSLAAWLFVLLVTLPRSGGICMISLVKEAQRTESKNERPNRK